MAGIVAEHRREQQQHQQSSSAVSELEDDLEDDLQDSEYVDDEPEILEPESPGKLLIHLHSTMLLSKLRRMNHIASSLQ